MNERLTLGQLNDIVGFENDHKPILCNFGNSAFEIRRCTTVDDDEVYLELRAVDIDFDELEHILPKLKEHFANINEVEDYT